MCSCTKTTTLHLRPTAAPKISTCRRPLGTAGVVRAGHALGPRRSRQVTPPPSPTVALLTFFDAGSDGGVLLGESLLLLFQVRVQRHLALVAGFPLQGVCWGDEDTGATIKLDEDIGVTIKLDWHIA